MSVAEYGVSIVSLHEQTIGCHAYLNRAKDAAGLARGYQMLDRVLATYSWETVVPFDAAAATKQLELTNSAVRVATMDLRIAAIALVHDLTLLTRNAPDFLRVPGLKIEDWTQ